MAFLQIESNDGQIKEFELQMDRMVIGRSPDADVVVPDGRVSRRHAVVQRNGSGQWELQDLGSRNKTFIGSEVVSTHVLRSGDAFSIGGVAARFVEKATPVHIPGSTKRVGPLTLGIPKIQSPQCPECHAPIAPSTVLCVHCGYNLKTGKKFSSAALEAPATNKSPSPTTSPSTNSAGAGVVCPCCEQMRPATSKVCVQCGIDIRTGRAIQTVEEGHLDKAYMYAESIIRIISWIFGIGVYPIASEAFGLRKPWIIRGIGILTVLVSGWFLVAYIYNPNPDPGLKNLMHWCGNTRAYQQEVNRMYTELKSEGYDETMIQAVMSSQDVADVGQYHPYQMITSAFLHGGILHLAGNMLFLMILGSRVNALIGNFLTLLIYPLLAVASAFIHMMVTAGEPLFPTLGASGAIMGLAGMYLVLMPTPNIHMAAWCRWGLIGGFNLNMKLFAVRGFWVVLFYIAFDVIYTVLGLEDNVAHWVHLGGFLSGIAIGLTLLLFRVVNARGGDLISVIFGKRAWPLIGKPNSNNPTFW